MESERKRNSMKRQPRKVKIKINLKASWGPFSWNKFGGPGEVSPAPPTLLVGLNIYTKLQFIRLTSSSSSITYIHPVIQRLPAASAHQSLSSVALHGFSSFPDADEGVRFLLNGKTYQNNSLVALKDIGEVNNSLLCLTNNTMCCARDQVPGRGILGDWFYPNGTRVPNTIVRLTSLYYGQFIIWEFYRNRGPSVVRLHRRRGGVTGIYSCVIPDAAGVYQTLYIGVYTASTGKPLVSHLAYYPLNLCVWIL